MSVFFDAIRKMAGSKPETASITLSPNQIELAYDIKALDLDNQPIPPEIDAKLNAASNNDPKVKQAIIELGTDLATGKGDYTTEYILASGSPVATSSPSMPTGNESMHPSEAFSTATGLRRIGLDIQALRGKNTVKLKEKCEDAFYISPVIEIPDKRMRINLIFLGDTAGGAVMENKELKLGAEVVGGYLAAIMSHPEIQTILSQSAESVEAVANRIISILISNLNNEKTFAITTCELAINIEHEGKLHTVQLHLGDSRIYETDGSLLQQMTNDHRIGNDIHLGIASETVANFDNIRKIPGVLQSREITKPTLRLFCSDGLHELLTDEELRDVMQRAYSEFGQTKGFSQTTAYLQKLVQGFVGQYSSNLKGIKKPGSEEYRKTHDDISFVFEFLEPQAPAA